MMKRCGGRWSGPTVGSSRRNCAAHVLGSLFSRIQTPLSSSETINARVVFPGQHGGPSRFMCSLRHSFSLGLARISLTVNTVNHVFPDSGEARCSGYSAVVVLASAVVRDAVSWRAFLMLLFTVSLIAPCSGRG
jgi:hypothetical protein